MKNCIIDSSIPEITNDEINFDLFSTAIPTEIEPGTYTATITHYELIQQPNRKPYIELTIDTDIHTITDKLYQNNTVYFLKAVRNQLARNPESPISYHSALDLRTALKLLENFPIEITVSYDPKYGRQIDYRIHD